MTNETVRLLSSPSNYAVVYLPGRRFPGVVVQGDSLNSLVKLIHDLQTRTHQYGDEEVDAGLLELEDILCGALRHYEMVCKEQNLSLPYPK